jgi:hypothetical protein
MHLPRTIEIETSIKTDVMLTAKQLVEIRTTNFMRGFVVFNSNIGEYGLVHHYNEQNDKDALNVIILKDKGDFFVTEPNSKEISSRPGENCRKYKTSRWSVSSVDIIHIPEGSVSGDETYTLYKSSMTAAKK